MTRWNEQDRGGGGGGGVDIYRGMGKVKGLWKAVNFSNPE